MLRPNNVYICLGIYFLVEYIPVIFGGEFERKSRKKNQIRFFIEKKQKASDSISTY